MDLPELLALFLEHLLGLFAMGYFERNRFRQFYVAAVADRGFTFEYFSLIQCSMGTNLQTMVQIVATMGPDFQQLVTFAEGFNELATRLGACRAIELSVSITFFAQIRHQAGCFIYVKLLQSEFATLSVCFQVIYSIILLLPQDITVSGMDLPRLQSQFTRYFQSLLSMSYLDRCEFRTVFVHISGLPSECFSLFRDGTNATLRIMEQALSEPGPDFPMVIEMADDLLLSSARIGASRIRNVVGYISICAITANEQGCRLYSKMTRLELEALLYSLGVITEVNGKFI